MDEAGVACDAAEAARYNAARYNAVQNAAAVRDANAANAAYPAAVDAWCAARDAYYKKLEEVEI